METFIYLIAGAIIGAAYAIEPVFGIALICGIFFQKLEGIRKAITNINKD